jgi:hypothetical protein
MDAIVAAEFSAVSRGNADSADAPPMNADKG